jgi:tetratricopeptide (TPR) repeat protein
MHGHHTLESVGMFALVLGLRVAAAAQETGDTASTNQKSTKAELSAQHSEPPSEAPETKADVSQTETLEPDPEKPLAELTIDELKTRLKTEPENHDIKVLLAIRLSWQDQRKGARELAQQVIDANPEYYDAQILIARIDFWDKRYQDALERVMWVRDRVPKNQDALRLWAQIQVSVAYKLSWKKESRARAREMAFEIVQAIDDYWDAHILLSRIDLWDGKLDHAFVRISMVRVHQPKSDEVLLIWTQIRLAQAQQSWGEGENEKARQIALEVTEAVADNWDAHLLIARVDAREGRYDEASKRISKILAADPQRKEALELQADIGLWSANEEQASIALDRLEAINRSEKGDRTELANIYYRRAQLALQKSDSINAYRLAGRALEIDPSHRAARTVQKETHLFTTDVAGQFEVYPVPENHLKYGGGTAITATIFPRSLNSLTLLYEYIYRFAAHNHRITVRSDWRVTNALTLMGSIRYGDVEVVPRDELQLSADYQFDQIYGGGFIYILDGILYTLDEIKRPSYFHRLCPMVRVNLPLDFNVETHYTFGVFAQPDSTNLLHGVHIRTTWAPQPLEVYVQYDYGMDPELLVLRSVRQGSQYPSNEPPEQTDELSEPPDQFQTRETQYHEVGTQLLYHIDKNLLVRVGYSLQIRFEGDLVHMTHLGVRRWF